MYQDCSGRAKTAQPIWGLDGGLRTVLLLFCRGGFAERLVRDTLESVFLCDKARSKSAFASIKFRSRIGDQA